MRVKFTKINKTKIPITFWWTGLWVNQKTFIGVMRSNGLKGTWVPVEDLKYAPVIEVDPLTTEEE